MQLTAVYPGTFDPITSGHLDLIRRAALVVERLVVGVAADTGKDALFSLEERRDMVRTEIAALSETIAARIEVMTFSGLLVDFARTLDAGVIVRGLRAVSDFEYEFQMACMNTRLGPEIQTIFLPAAENMQFVSSRFIKQICRLGGDISSMAPPRIVARLQQYFAAQQQNVHLQEKEETSYG